MVMPHANEAVSKIRRGSFIRDFRVFCRTQSFKLYSLRLIFSRSNVPNVIEFTKFKKKCWNLTLKDILNCCAK